MRNSKESKIIILNHHWGIIISPHFFQKKIKIMKHVKNIFLAILIILIQFFTYNHVLTNVLHYAKNNEKMKISLGMIFFFFISLVIRFITQEILKKRFRKLSTKSVAQAIPLETGTLILSGAEVIKSNSVMMTINLVVIFLVFFLLWALEYLTEGLSSIAASIVAIIVVFLLLNALQEMEDE